MLESKVFLGDKISLDFRLSDGGSYRPPGPVFLGL